MSIGDSGLWGHWHHGDDNLGGAMKTRIPIILNDELPACECCGAPIYRRGLCSVCASVIASVEVPLGISARVVVSEGDWINPEDLSD